MLVRGLRGRRKGARAVASGFARRGARSLVALAGLPAVRVMAPLLAPGRDRAGREDEDGCEARGDRKVLAVSADRRGSGRARGSTQGRDSISRFPQARKPLVEKKRRARINESLQELRLLLAGAEVRPAGSRVGSVQGLRARGPASPHLPSPAAQVQAKLENAEVLELTVRRVQGALRGRARGEWRPGARRAGVVVGRVRPACRGAAPLRTSLARGRGRPPRLLGELRSRGPGGPGHSGRGSRDPARLSPPPSPSAEREQLQAEASERFAAGYIQCMHEVHTFVSTCQAIDATVAAELLNHLLESMPLREGSSFRDLLGDALSAPPAAPGRSNWLVRGSLESPLPSPRVSGEDQSSDLEEVPEVELSRAAPAEGTDSVPAAQGSLTAARLAQSVWRPW